jgi:hypothetical protein
MAEDLTTPGPSRDAVVETSAPPASPEGYELIDEIGRGGMGVVYRARDTALDREVAVKLLSERYPAGESAAQRFLSEARITGQLQHPGIPAVYQVGSLADGRPFLAMKLIKGSTLEAILKHRTDLSAETGSRRWSDIGCHRAGGARALALLAGLSRETKLGVTTAEAARFADQAVASLRDTINAGWNWPNELKEPDFDALRGRADFRKLVAEVETGDKANAAKKEAESK